MGTACDAICKSCSCEGKGPPLGFSTCHQKMDMGRACGETRILNMDLESDVLERCRVGGSVPT